MDHRGSHVAVAQKLLDRPDVVAALEQVRREGVPERVAACVLRHAGIPDRTVDGALDDGLVQMMPSPLACQGLAYVRVAGKTHCHAGSRPAFGYFRPSACGSSTPSRPGPPIAVVERLDRRELTIESRHDGCRKQRHTVAIALAAADDQLMRREIDVLYAQAAALEQA